MGVYWGFFGPILLNSVLDDVTPGQVNVVLMFIAGTLAGAFGLFLGVRIIQTGSLDVDTMLPFKSRQDY